MEVERKWIELFSCACFKMVVSRIALAFVWALAIKVLSKFLGCAAKYLSLGTGALMKHEVPKVGRPMQH